MHRNAVLTEDALRSYYTDDEDLQILLDAERYSLFAGGKRIRPMLTIEFCRLFGGDEAAALPFACAVEMIHTYSLIHDDLPCMDDDELRRGKPCNHKVFGEGMAVLAGDALLTGAFEAAATNMEAGPEISAMAVAYIAGCAGRYGMIGGQVMDLEGEGREMSLESLLKMHSYKTHSQLPQRDYQCRHRDRRYQCRDRRDGYRQGHRRSFSCEPEWLLPYRRDRHHRSNPPR